MIAMRVDWESRTVHCSVGELVRAAAKERASGLPRSAGFRRMWLGQELHLQRAAERAMADPHYRSEVSVAREVEHAGWTIRIAGRIDGLSHDPARGLTVVEEVKSLHFTREMPNLERSGQMQEYLYQLMLYALFLSFDEAHAGTTFYPQLVLTDLASDRIRIIPAPWDPDEVGRAFEQSLEVLTAKLESQRLMFAARRELAANLPFPHERPRPQQGAMVDAVARAMEQGEVLMVSAPTGIGKTAAALYPALRDALQHGRKLYFLTSKTLQQEMAVEALDRMNDGTFRVLRIRAKKKMCAHDQMICHEDYCPFAKRYGEKMDRSGLLEHLVSTHAYLDPDTIFESARMVQVCPFEVTMEIVEHADVIVCDYNYIFDPWLSLSSFRERTALEDPILIVDEAHNLVSRARGYFSPELSDRMLRDVASHLALRPGAGLDGWEDLVDDLSDEIRRLVEELELHREDTPKSHDLIALCEPDVRLFRRQLVDWERLVLQYIEWKIASSIADEDDPVMNFYWELVRFTELLEEDPEVFARIIQRTTNTTSVRIFCKDPSRHLSGVLAASHATVLMSATLEPFEFHERTIGIPRHRAATLALPSPFPAENRKILVVPSIDTTWKRRSESYDRVASLVTGIADAAGGNTLALFPSYDYLARVAEQIPPTRANVEIQRSDMTEWERRTLLDVMRDRSRTTLVLAVSGGMYAEGVDYRGEMLKCVVVVGPSLPTVSFEQKLLEAYYQEHFEAGFDYAFLIPGMTRVVQSAGRVIRSETDTGVIVLMCRRFMRHQYNRLFPTHWYESSPSELVSRSPEADVARFTERINQPQMRLFS